MHAFSASVLACLGLVKSDKLTRFILCRLHRWYPKLIYHVEYHSLLIFIIHIFSIHKNSTSHDNYILPSEVLFHCPRYLVLLLFRYLYFTIKCVVFQFSFLRSSLLQNRSNTLQTIFLPQSFLLLPLLLSFRNSLSDIFFL